jgi:hypothetical protein
MSTWRVIFTDSEGMTGIAPVCEVDHTPHSPDGDDALKAWVFDCCPRPHIEFWSERSAKHMVEHFNANGAADESVPSLAQLLTELANAVQAKDDTAHANLRATILERFGRSS